MKKWEEMTWEEGVSQIRLYCCHYYREIEGEEYSDLRMILKLRGSYSEVYLGNFLAEIYKYNGKEYRIISDSNKKLIIDEMLGFVAAKDLPKLNLRILQINK